MAQHMNAKRTGRGKWLARCSSHPDRNASLSITEGKTHVLLCCWSMRCDVQDIVSAAGLRMGDLRLNAGVAMDPKAIREAQRKRQAVEMHAKNIRIGRWVLRFLDQGYTLENRAEDIALACAAAGVASQSQKQGEQRVWEGLVHLAFERMEAANHMRDRGMLGHITKSPCDWHLVMDRVEAQIKEAAHAR